MVEIIRQMTFKHKVQVPNPQTAKVWYKVLIHLRHIDTNNKR
jgi:hypothetical protein